MTTVGAVPSGANANQTLAQAVGGNIAVTLSAGDGALSPNVVLGQQFFDNDPGRQGVTLLHELLHYATQMGDLKLDEVYGITGKNFDSASSALSAWLANDCKN